MELRNVRFNRRLRDMIGFPLQRGGDRWWLGDCCLQFGETLPVVFEEFLKFEADLV